jgi:outer membrane protein TolC
MGVTAQDPRPRLEEQVLVSNQTVAQAEARFRGARSAIRGIRANLFPTVTARASAVSSRVSPNRSAVQRGAATGTAVEYQLPIDFSYELDTWGQIRRNVEASVAIAQTSSADIQTVALSMRAELAIDYFELRGLDAARRLFETTVAAYDRALQLTIARYN